MQVPGQLIDPSVDVTVPLPVPAVALTVSVKLCCWLKVDVTDVAALIDTVQVVLVPEQPPPLQPPKVDPLAGTAVSVTTVPRS